MSILTDIKNDVDKGVSFVEKVFSKVEEVDQIWLKLEPATKAAVLATAYDTLKAAASVGTEAKDVVTGDWSGAVSLTPTTIQLVKNVVTDVKADVAVAKNDLTELGIL